MKVQFLDFHHHCRHFSHTCMRSCNCQNSNFCIDIKGTVALSTFISSHPTRNSHSSCQIYWWASSCAFVFNLLKSRGPTERQSSSRASTGDGWQWATTLQWFLFLLGSKSMLSNHRYVLLNIWDLFCKQHHYVHWLLLRQLLKAARSHSRMPCSSP